ncbi:hypothetical protein LOTGIDRAFT_154803 [Lottia gigantea]|uniref:Apple domain-containing protein n=1 Tax=Lottia gigantea TaxID=225164 RepID=V4A1X6_LOTGI|nr:hypothetical protein LOTGIDRAFT_154803 [Lottia gigantea]ESO87306.1 hypothetical protein LOTGIDRAFT_154803 [Lottia gigantea]
MNKFLCSVLLVLVGIWLATVGFTDAVQCTSDPIIINGVFDSDITSREVGAVYDFTCNGTLEDTGTVTCDDIGDWTTNLTCEECYLPNKYFYMQYSFYCVSSEDECVQKCDEMNCKAYYTVIRQNTWSSCYVFLPYIIFRGTGMSVQQCIDKCNEMDECLTIRYRPIRGDLCYLFKVTVTELVAMGNVLRSTSTGTIIGKRSICP